MSVTSLLFPSTGGLGATPESRGAAPGRPEAAGPAFSHWLQRAQPSPATPNPGSLPATHSGGSAPPKASHPSAPTRPQGGEPSKRPEASGSASSDPGAEPSVADETDEALPPASGELPGAWWLQLPEPPAARAGGIALAADGSADKTDGASKASATAMHELPAFDDASGDADGDDTHPPLAEEVMALDTLGDTEVAEAFEGMLPPATASVHAGRGAEPAGSPSPPWLSGLSAVSGASGANPANPAPAVAQQALATPVHDPDFPEALAHSITVLTRQGVQEAQLHLNPAEMGTVSVHIAVNGQQAQVEFAASTSATRAALEASLSHLAAALHSAGLTLTGGGVSQEAPPRRNLSAEAGTRPRQAPGEEAEGAGSAPQLLPRPLVGRLDLYA